MRPNGRGCVDQERGSAGFWLQVRLLFRNGGIPEELATAFGTDQRRASSRFGRWEAVDDDVLNPVAMVTGTAVVVVPVRRGVPGALRQSLL